MGVVCASGEERLRALGPPGSHAIAFLRGHIGHPPRRAPPFAREQEPVLSCPGRTAEGGLLRSHVARYSVSILREREHRPRRLIAWSLRTQRAVTSLYPSSRRFTPWRASGSITPQPRQGDASLG